MKLYFRPLACSLSSRIVMYEGELAAELIEVDRAQRTSAGSDYLAVHPLGLVPALALAGGRVLTENAAILQYLADLAPDRALAPRDELGRAQLRQWLSFIAAELHEGFVPLLDKTAVPEVKAWSHKRLQPRLGYVANHLADRPYLLGDYSVADPYLFAILNWTQVTPIQLATWPALAAFMSRMHERPAVQRAFREERDLYVAELGRAKA